MNQNQPNQTKPATKGSNIGLIVTIVILGMIIFLGVGGYFAWKYYFSKLIKSSANVTVSPSPTTTPSPSPTATPTPTTTSSSALRAGTMPANGYMISDSNTRVIAETEIINFTPWQLKVARNEIYARHGRPFVHKDLQCYFANQSWYHGNPNYSENLLTAIENKNVSTIQTYEKKINSPLQNHDSGC